MSRIYKLDFTLLLGLLLCATSRVVWAESGMLVVHVKDVQQRPIGGLQIGVEGDGGSSITEDDGKARIPLAKQNQRKELGVLADFEVPTGQRFRNGIALGPQSPDPIV